eukprot:365880-Chlamydomonas_euryale.AAC.2
MTCRAMLSSPWSGCSHSNHMARGTCPGAVDAVSPCWVGMQTCLSTSATDKQLPMALPGCLRTYKTHTCNTACCDWAHVSMRCIEEHTCSVANDCLQSSHACAHLGLRNCKPPCHII